MGTKQICLSNYCIDVLFLQLIDLLPGWTERLVLSMRDNPVVYQLQDCKRVRFAPDVRRMEALGLQNLHHQVADILDFFESLRGFLKTFTN